MSATVDGPASRFPVTFFKSYGATKKEEADWSLEALALRIETATAPQKAELPWLKMARFGDSATAKNSLRHDANVLSVTGIEADYDAGEVSFSAAVEIVVKAGILALIYTSPSHTEAAPRWRVLCPLSRGMPPDQRGKMLGRLNGLYCGILAGESWTLSQSYYYGSVDRNPSHQVELIDGTPIDLHDDLDAIWLGKPNTTQHSNGNGQTPPFRSGPADEAALLEQIATGESYHAPAMRLLGKWALAGVPLLDAKTRIVDAMYGVPPAMRDARWSARAADLDRCIVDIYGKKTAQDTGPRPWPIPDLALATASGPPVPAFPVADVFPMGVAFWIQDAANAAGAPVDYVAGALLAAAGACIGNARWGQPKEGWAEPPVVNVALIGRPSAGKSPALDQVTKPLYALAAALNEDWQDRRRQHMTDAVAAEERCERWKKEVKAATANGDTPPMQPVDAVAPPPLSKRRLVSTDPTVAKAERMSAANPRGLLLERDELAGWLGGMDRFGSGGSSSDRAFWLQAYGGRPWSPDRVKDGDDEIFVPHLTWAIMGGIQPDRLATLLLGGDDDGMSARFLYFWPEPQPPWWSEAGPNLAAGEDLLARLRSLPWTPPAPILLPFERDAQVILQEWREDVAQMEEGATGLFLSWLGKMPGFAVRLATILAHLTWAEDGDAADPPEAIGRLDVLRATSILREYAVPMAKRSFGEAALPVAERDARRVARWLLRRHPCPTNLNVRELRRMADGPGVADADRLTAAMEELAALGWVRSTPGRDAARAGRTRNDWAVNPGLSLPTPDDLGPDS